MNIVWDEPKRLANLQKHQLDFASLTVKFFEQASFYPAKHGRHLAIGELDDRMVITVVFWLLGSEGVSVLSMRPASRKERGSR